MATFTQLSSGNWRCQVRRRGRYAAETFRRKKDADSWALEVERRFDRGEELVAKRPAVAWTFGDLIGIHVKETPASSRGWSARARAGFRSSPRPRSQTCIVHLMRNGLSLCAYKDRRQVARDMKAIYRAETVEAAADRLAEFEQLRGAKYPSIVAGWRRHWEEIIPMFAFAPEIRRLIYTTNAIESLHRGLRKIIKTRGHFPNDQAARKLLFLAIRNIEKGWKAAPKEWLPALNQFDILFGERLRGKA